MTKTIPMWAAVVNAAVAAARHEHGAQSWDMDVHLPLSVSATEQQQIREHLAGWVLKLQEVRGRHVQQLQP